MAASEDFACFLNTLRSSGSEFNSSNAQLAELVLNALEIVSPDSDDMDRDRDQLVSDFEVVVEALRFAEED